MMKFLQLKTKNALLVLIACLFSFSGSSQSWQWAKSFGGSSTDGATYSCVDPSGNVFIAGYFGSPSISIGTITINNAGSTGTDVFISKWDANGNVLWAQRIAGTGSEFLNGICGDASGRVYVTGAHNSPTLSIPPFFVTNSTGQNDAWVACFDGFGSPVWLKQFGGPTGDSGEGLAYSNSQNALYMSGAFSSTAMVVGTTTLTNSNNTGFSNDIFLIKLTSTGNPTWAIRTGGANSADNAMSVGIDASNQYPFIGGTFSPPSASTPTTMIGTTVLTTMGNTDVFVAKYSDLGAFQWARSGGSTSSSDNFYELTVDGSNNVYISGSYFGAPMVIGTTTLTNAGSSDAFFAKYNNAGTLQFAKSVFTSGNTGNDDAQGITCDANNNIYMAGIFSGSVVTNAAGSLTNTATGGSSDVYVAKFNSSGTAQWLTSAQGSNYESGRYISSDALGNLYVAGSYNVSGPTAFGTTTVNSVGGNDGFVAKIGCLSTAITGPSNVCAGSSATLTATGATTYTWSTGANTPSIVITPTTSGTYTVNGSTGSCIGTPSSLSVTSLPASLYAGSNLNLLCKQNAVINASCSPSSTLVAWSPSTNLSSSSVLNPTVTSGVGTTQYTVTTTLSNGCVKTGTVNVSSYAQTPNICQVTVDSLGTNNEIYWDKTNYPQADSFFVYREVTTSVYKKIASLPYSAFSMYTDTNRTIGPANGNPNLTYYKYKMQLRDSCGNYSPMSLWHETIFIQDQLNGNFNWNMYSIESTTSTPVTLYNLKRRDLATGTETLVTSTTGGLATDPLYNSFWPSNVKWFVDALGFSCNTTMKYMPNTENPTDKLDPNVSIQLVKTKTKSNQSNDKLFATVVNSIYGNNSISVYPNPAGNWLNVDVTTGFGNETKVEIRNTLGQLIQSNTSTEKHMSINTSDIANGVYMITISQGNKTVSIKKLVVDK